MARGRENGPTNCRPLHAVTNGSLGVLLKELGHELLVVPALVSKALAPVVVGIGRNRPKFLSYALDCFRFVGIMKNGNLLCVGRCFDSVRMKAQTKFPLHLVSEVGGNDVSQTLNEVRHSSD